MTYWNEHLLAILSVACWLAGMILGYGIRYVKDGWQTRNQDADDCGNPFIRRFH